MAEDVLFEKKYHIEGGDFINGGDASCRIGTILKDVGIDEDTILRATVAAYEAEMNVVLYARRGTMNLCIDTGEIKLTVEDEGQGIANVQLAMQEGYSTATEAIREMGFGAGMGLPNIKNNADYMDIQSTVGKGTRLLIKIKLSDPLHSENKVRVE